MPNALDQRIDEWGRRLTDLRRRAAEIESEANVIEIKLEAFREARTLMEKDVSASQLSTSAKLPEERSRETKATTGTLPSGRASRLSDQWQHLFGFALSRYPQSVTNQEFSDEAEKIGLPVIRNNLRSALWTHMNNGLLEKVETGVHRITENGARAIGRELPKRLEAESVERNPAPLSASHEPPHSGVIRQPDATNVREAALRPVEPVLGGGT